MNPQIASNRQLSQGWEIVCDGKGGINDRDSGINEEDGGTKALDEGMSTLGWEGNGTFWCGGSWVEISFSICCGPSSS